MYVCVFEMSMCWNMVSEPRVLEGKSWWLRTCATDPARLGDRKTARLTGADTGREREIWWES